MDLFTDAACDSALKAVTGIVKQHRLGSSGGTDIHVDKTLGKDETVSSDSLGKTVTRNKLKKFRNIRRKAINLYSLRKEVLNIADRDVER